MFGVDQMNYSNTYPLKSFYDKFCPLFGFDESCESIFSMKEVDQPVKWQSFTTYGANFVPIGMAVGALLFSPPVCRKYGRRLALCLSGAVTMAGCASTVLVNSVFLYLASRLLTGVGCGIACHVLPMYTAEMSPQSIRGTLGSLFQFMIVVSQFSTVIIFNCAGLDMSYQWGFLMPGMVGFVIAIAVWFFPESPKFLIEHKGKEAGRAALQSVRANDCSAELDAIEEYMKREREAGVVPWIQLFTKPGLRRRVFIACWIQIAQQLTGINVFLNFQTEIFSAAHLSKAYIIALPFGAKANLQWCFMVGSILGLTFIDSKHGGRRFQLLCASILMTAVFVLTAVVQFADLSFKDGMKCACVYVMGFGFQFAWGIVPWIYPAELFSAVERERALAISTCLGFWANTLVLQVQKPIVRLWGDSGMYTFYAATNALNLLFVVFFIKETKGVPEEDIPYLFGEKEKKDQLIVGEQA